MRALVEPLAADAAVDVVDVQVRGSGGRRLVRVVVDRRGGVDLATCQGLSRRLSARLDDDDPVEGSYSLEVTSPGVGHPLRDRRAFERVLGRDVLVHRRGADGRVLQIGGTVTGAEADAVVLDVDGAPMRIAYAEIVKAAQRLPW